MPILMRGVNNVEESLRDIYGTVEGGMYGTGYYKGRTPWIPDTYGNGVGFGGMNGKGFRDGNCGIDGNGRSIHKSMMMCGFKCQR